MGSRPTLTIDFHSPKGNLRAVFGQARALLSGEDLTAFTQIVEAAISAGQDYKAVLAIINLSVRIVDTSGMYPEYASGAQEP